MFTPGLGKARDSHGHVVIDRSRDPLYAPMKRRLPWWKRLWNRLFGRK